MAREIGIDQTSKHQCAFCEEPYDRSAFRGYMLKSRSQKIKCNKCDNTSHFIRPDELNKAAHFRAVQALFFIYLLPFPLVTLLSIKLVEFKFIERGLGGFVLFLLFAALIATYLGSLYKKFHRWKFFEVEKIKPKEGAVKRGCAHCQETFDSSEFWNFILQTGANHVKCIRCENTSYFTSADELTTASRIAYHVLLILCVSPFFLAFMLINKFRTFDGPVFWMFLAGAFVITIFVAGFSMKFYTWFFSAIKKN